LLSQPIAVHKTAICHRVLLTPPIPHGLPREPDRETKSKKLMKHLFTASVAFFSLAMIARSDTVLVELNFSGPANEAVTQVNAATGWHDGDAQVKTAAPVVAMSRANVVGGTLETGKWSYNSTGTAVKNTDLYSGVMNFGNPTRFTMRLELASTGHAFTVTAAQIDVKAASGSTLWAVGFRDREGVDRVVGPEAISIQGESEETTTYTIDLSGEVLTASDNTMAWDKEAGIRWLFRESASGIDVDDFQVEAIRLIGTISTENP